MPYTVTSSPEQYQVILRSETTQVVTVSPPGNAEIITVGEQGPPGAPGAPATGGRLSWQTVTDSISMQANTGYLVNSLTLATLLLPATSQVGDLIQIASLENSLFRVAQRVGQAIRFGTLGTQTGILGRIDSTALGDRLDLICIQADLRWAIAQCQGHFEIS